MGPNQEIYTKLNPPSIKPNPIKAPRLLYTNQNCVEETSEPIGNQEPNPNQQAPENPASKPVMRTKEAPKQSQNQVKTKPKLKTQPRISELFKPTQDPPPYKPSECNHEYNQNHPEGNNTETNQSTPDLEQPIWTTR